MEKIKNRDNFLKNFEKIFNEVKIDKNFEHELKEYRFFKDHATYIEVREFKYLKINMISQNWSTSRNNKLTLIIIIFLQKI
jgi:hypothetical protein